MFSPVGFFNNPSTQHRSHTRYRPKPLSQRNLVSAFFGLTTVIFITTALVEPRWFRVQGEDPSCANKPIGIYKMLSLKSTSSRGKQECYSDDTVLKLKIIMAFLCCGTFCSFTACLLDIWGPRKKMLQLIRSNSIGNIISVVMSVASCAFSYWVTVSIKKHLEYKNEKHVHVKFWYSFYLVVAGGVCALLACAFNMINCNCRRNHGSFSSEEELTAELMNSMDTAAPSTIRGEPPPVYSV